MVISGKIDDCFAHINGITTGSKVFHVDMQSRRHGWDGLMDCSHHRHRELFFFGFLRLNC